MAELPAAFYLGVFTRAEQRVLAAILRAIAQDGGRCVATPGNARPCRGRKQVNHPQRDQPGGRNRPSGKDRTPLLLRSLASEHFDDGAAPAPRRRRPSPLELPAAIRSSAAHLVRSLQGLSAAGLHRSPPARPKGGTVPRRQSAPHTPAINGGNEKMFGAK
jgi:hypothetical protein